MRKDKDGFMDITWCKGKVLQNWNDLRETFQKSNARKAIAPTQFNHQSTRGHCIMVLEVEMPQPSDNTRKQKGRVYVCDLAGTEPAGDIYSAKYEKKLFPDGSVEHRLIGPHDDKSKPVLFTAPPGAPGTPFHQPPPLPPPPFPVAHSPLRPPLAPLPRAHE